MQISINLFLGVLLFIGLVLTVCSFILATSVADCSIHAQNAVRGLLTMGVGLFCISATMLLCKCGANFDKDGSILGNVFPVFIMLIGGITIGLVSTIHKECEKARKMTPALITLSVFITLGSGGYLGLKIYNNVKNQTQLGLVESQSYGSASSDGSMASSNASSPTSLYGG
jgi:cytochrome bd-type quinol oxidase subunit 2